MSLGSGETEPTPKGLGETEPVALGETKTVALGSGEMEHFSLRTPGPKWAIGAFLAPYPSLPAMVLGPLNGRTIIQLIL